MIYLHKFGTSRDRSGLYIGEFTGLVLWVTGFRKREHLVNFGGGALVTRTRYGFCIGYSKKYGWYARRTSRPVV